MNSDLLVKDLLRAVKKLREEEPYGEGAHLLTTILEAHGVPVNVIPRGMPYGFYPKIYFRPSLPPCIA